MQLILSLACINYRMLPEEAINAVTLNSAYAMGLSEELGSIARGKRANLSSQSLSLAMNSCRMLMGVIKWIRLF